jgi:dTDP-4-dehydrorhamnose reductase
LPCRITDFKTLGEFLYKRVRWMTVIAAHTRLVQSLSDPELNFEINAAVTLNVLRACRATGFRK